MRVSWFLVTWLALVAAVPAWGEDERPPEPRPAVPADQIEHWIKQLDSDRFNERETATKKLVAAGATAIEPLVRAMAHANLEVSARGTYVLRELALQGDDDSAESAEEGLRKLSKQFASVGSRARATLEQLADVREERSMKLLQRQGAKFRSSAERIFAMQAGIAHTASQFSLEIDESWRGSDSDLRKLRWLKSVDRVHFMGSRVTNRSLEFVAEMPGLTILTIRSAPIDDGALRVVLKHGHLQQVAVMNCPITDESLAVFEQARLTRLLLYNTQVTFEGKERLARAAGIEVDYRAGAMLGVKCDRNSPCRVHEVMEKSAAKSADIQERDLIVRIDADLIRDFEDLRKSISRLRPGATAELDVVRGGDAVPLTIPRVNQTPLGIVGQPHALGVRVTRIEPGSAAAGAGVLVGDVVVSHSRLNELPLSTPSLESLEARYAAQMGEATVTVFRGFETLTKAVRFDVWNELPEDLK